VSPTGGIVQRGFFLGLLLFDRKTLETEPGDVSVLER